jgi:predicted RecB family nuclease
MKNPRFSKSKYLSGLQCPKRLYLEIHSPELAGEIDEGTQARFDIGTEVGALARGCYPEGVLVEVEHFKVTQGLRRTAELLTDPSVPAIYEAFVQFANVLVRADILERVRSNRWRVIEVKSTAQVKEEHLDDLAIQSYVLTGAGLKLDAPLLMHINTGYVYPGGDLDLRQLFVCEDLTREVANRQAHIPGRLAEMRRVLTASMPPAIEPDYHCGDPYECPFWDHCTENKPARWVFYLPGGSRTFQKLVGLGVQTIDAIPPAFPLTDGQRRMKENVEWVGRGLKAALGAIRYPVHHLDFETLGPAIPVYPNTRPYQTIPFQWSNHIETRDGAVRHGEYLCSGKEDPREEFTVALLRSLGKTGSICTYTNYERTILTGLAEALPVLRRDLHRVIDRLWDLHPIIKENYYHPGFEGSYSIKSVLPAVVPHLAYDDLEIQEGTMAGLQYYRMIFEVTDEGEGARLRTALLKYCERDTLALVELRRALRSKASG